MGKNLNYFFFFLTFSYFIFLLSRLFVNKVPKIIITFLFFYVIFSLGLLLIKFVLILKQRFKKKESKMFIKIREKVLLLKKAFVEDFFLEFLAENKKMRKIFYFFIKLSEKFIEKDTKIIILVKIIPWILFLSVLSYNLYNQDFLFIGLYIWSLQTIINCFFFIFCETTLKFVSSLARSNLVIYFPKIATNNEALSFFIYNPLLKNKMLDFVQAGPKEISFLWELFSKFHHFYCLDLKINIFKMKLSKTQSLLRNVNLVVFSNILLFLLSKNVVMLSISLVFSFFLVFFLVGQFLYFFANDRTYKNFKNYPLVTNEWFLEKQQSILEKQNLYLTFPYVNNKTYQLMVKEYFEIIEIIKENQKLPSSATRFQEFSRFSDYHLDFVSFLIIQDIETFAIEFFLILQQNNFIDPLTYKIKASTNNV